MSGAAITLTEWESRVVQVDALAVAGMPLDELARKAEPLVVCRPTWGGAVEMRAGGRVGELQFGALQLRVQPHLAVGDVLTLFGWVEGAHMHLDPERLGVGGHAPTLAELIAAALVEEAHILLRGDLLRRSVVREERLIRLRGRPRFEDWGLRPPHLGLTCRFHELSTDTLDNRLIRAGLELAIRRLHRQRTAAHRALRALAVFHDLCSPLVPSPADFDRAREQQGPRTRAYAPGHRLARWLLLGGGPLSSWGLGGTQGWSLDMPALFEQAVARGVRTWAARFGWRVAEQPRKRFAITDGRGASYTTVRPDLEVLDGDRVLAVVDSKYKAYGEVSHGGAPVRRLAPADAYQLGFYSAVSDASAYVVCPKGHEGELSEVWRRLRVGQRPVTLVPVDVRELVRRGEVVLDERRLSRDGQHGSAVRKSSGS